MQRLYMCHFQGFYNRVLHLLQPSKQSTRYTYLWIFILYFRTVRSTQMPRIFLSFSLSVSFLLPLSTTAHTYHSFIVMVVFTILHVLRAALHKRSVLFANQKNAPACRQKNVSCLNPSLITRANCTPNVCICDCCPPITSMMVVVMFVMKLMLMFTFIYLLFLARTSSFAQLTIICMKYLNARCVHCVAEQ